MRAKEICQLRAVLQPDHMALRGIEKRSRPQVNEPRPTLTMAVAEWNAGYGETLVGKWPEIRRKQSHRVCHLPAHCLRHGGGCERADRALPGVAELKGLWFARRQWFRQNHRDIVAV